MLTDYKFWYIKRDDNGKIIEAAVRFYEGDITTEDELNEDGVLVPVTRYRRTARLDPKLEDHVKDRAIKKDSRGNNTALYYPADFGEISTDTELTDFINKELKKDTKRSPVDEQKEKNA